MYNSNFTDNDELQEISGIKITNREVDVISCITHNRGTKKIASILSISHKTVASHIANISNKLGFNTKEGIIDVVERSGKLNHFRKHYFNLVINNLFRLKLKKLSLLNKKGETVSILNLDASINKILLTQLKYELSLVNIKVIENDKTESHRTIPSLVILGKMLNTQQLENKNNVFLLFDKEFDIAVLNDLNIDYLDFRQDINYHNILELIQKIINKNYVLEIITEFEQECKKLKSCYSLDANSSYEIKDKFTQKLSFIGISIIISILSVIIYFVIQHRSTAIDNISQPIKSDILLPNTNKLLQRPKIIKEIDKSFLNQTSIKTVALVGIGGAGKTTLARYYAKNISKAKTVVEFDASTVNNLNESYRKFADKLINEDKLISEQEKVHFKYLLKITKSVLDDTKIIDYIKKRLRYYSDWCLIYDGMENYSDIKEYVPHNEVLWGSGKIIITTRNKNLQHHELVDNFIEVKELENEEKLKLFLQFKGTEKFNTIEVEEFLTHIPPFPLDVSIAGKYIALHNASENILKNYLENLHNFTPELEKFRTSILQESGVYNLTRYKIISLSLEELISYNDQFQSLLLFISILDCHDIPLNLLKKYKTDVVVDSFILSLKKYFFIQSEGNSEIGPVISIHESTKEVILSYLKNRIDLKINKDLLIPMSDAIQFFINDLSQNSVYNSRFLLSHCENFYQQSDLLPDTSKGTIGILLSELNYFFNGADNSELIKLTEISLEYLKRNYNTNLEKIANAYSFLGTLHKHDTEKAKSLLEKSLAIYKEYNFNNLNLAQTLGRLGNVYRLSGNYKKAESLLKEGIAICEKYKLKNSSYARIKTALGALYRDLGNYRTAQNILEENVSLYKNFNTDTNNIISLIFLGSAYYLSGDYDHAKKTLEKCLLYIKSFKKVSNLLKGWVLSYLAEISNELGYYSEAKNLIEESYQLYPRNHEDFAWILMHLGRTYTFTGQYNQAKKYLNESLVLYKKNLNKEHIDIGLNLLYLGELYTFTEQYDQAKNCLNEGFVIFRDHYGEEHVQTTKFIIALGRTYFLEGKEIKKSEKYLYEALENFEKTKHPDKYIVLEILADLHLKQAEDNSTEMSVQDRKLLQEKSIEYLQYAQDILLNSSLKTSTHILRIKAKIKQQRVK